MYADLSVWRFSILHSSQGKRLLLAFCCPLHSKDGYHQSRAEACALCELAAREVYHNAPCTSSSTPSKSWDGAVFKGFPLIHAVIRTAQSVITITPNMESASFIAFLSLFILFCITARKASPTSSRMTT